MIEIKMPEEKEEVKGDLISRQAVIYYIKPYIQEIITESGVDKNEHTNRMLRAIINGIETMPTGKEEPAEDCISRQEAISAIQDKYYAHAVGIDIVDIVAHLPSVIPKAKTGKWIDIGDEGLVFKCSLCGNKNTIESHFCPNCGRRMQSDK